MESWIAWQFALALASVISVLALIIGELHVIEKVEEAKQAAWLKKARQSIYARR